MKARVNCVKMMGGEYGERKEEHLSNMVEAWACTAADRPRSLVFINVSSDRSNRMNSEVYRAILSAQI